MVFIHCPDCSTEVSSTEVACPSCSFPISKLMGLSSAILTKDAAMVAGLIQLGADVNAIDKNGRTPLMIASSIGSVEIVQMLLAAGASPEFENDAGETALKTARSRDVEKILRRALVVMRFASLHQKLPEPVNTTPAPKIEIPQEPVMDFDATQPIPASNPHIEEIVLGAQEAEPVHEQVSEQSQLITNPEEIIEETAFISPLIVQEPVDLNEIDEQEEVAANEPAEENSESYEPQKELNVMQVTEELFETSREDPFMKFITAQQVNTESSVWENRPEYETMIHFPIIPPKQTETPIEDRALNDELFEIPNLHEPFLSFQFSNQEQTDFSDRETSGSQGAAQLNNDFDFEEPSVTLNAAQQLQSKFEEREDWIELQQPAVDSTWNQEEEIREEERIETPQLESVEEPQNINCLECGEIIGVSELRCSKCHTAIAKRYCSNCSQLIPDHSIFCPYCKTYVAEHFHFAKRGPEKFIAGVTIGLCILILLMFLTWPTRNSKAAGQGAVRNFIPISKAVTIASAKDSEIMFIPPIIKTEQKKDLEPIQSKKLKATEVNPSPVKSADKIKKPITENSPPKLASTKQKPPQQTKTMTMKSSLNQVAPKPADEEKIKHGQSLSSQGVSLVKQGRPGEAIPLLEQSLRSFPKGTKDVHYATALFNLGVAWRMAGRPDIAIPILQKRIKINNQRDDVARELNTAKQQAREAGFGSFQ